MADDVAEQQPATGLPGGLLSVLTVLICVFGIIWVLSLLDYANVGMVSQQAIVIMLGLACAAAFLRYPYGSQAGLFEVLLALLACACWWWMGWNFVDWQVRLADRTPDMWIPGAIAIILMLEGVRKALGSVIAILVWLVACYAFWGDWLPGDLRAEVYAPTKTILYLYADGNGIPGLVLRIVIELVLAFVVFGKLMQLAGGTQFLNDLAMSLVGHKQGGSAKVSIVASSLFGSMSGSTVGNIMSTGVVTIPMMKRAGFRSEVAAAVEAVASNGGQLMPPVMGTTAFIIAEFLAIPYTDVVLAALIPALLYYVTLFISVDSIARAAGIRGIPKDQLPSFIGTLARGWLFLLPLCVLLYLLFWASFNPGRAALYATGSLFVLFLIHRRGRVFPREVMNFFRESGFDLVPLLLIGGAAGLIIGVMNSTGFAFQLSLLLTAVAEGYGLFAMLVLTALLCIALGMGMPTAAVYVVVVTVIAPTLIDLGMVPLAAHMFLFYFGLMSMLTPPVAIGSMVAANVAKADMWKTGKLGVWMGMSAYLLPFLWAFNPAVLFQGSYQAVLLAALTGAAAAVLLGKSIAGADNSPIGKTLRWLMFILALVVGSATVWIGPENWLSLLPAVFALCALRWLVPESEIKNV
ncbi:MAG: TRAP transporter fused permease subunit [Burkholderiaceae bacterium]